MATSSNLTHKQAIMDIFAQFDRYKSNCYGCELQCKNDRCDNTDLCEDNELICRKKLIEAAEELDS